MDALILIGIFCAAHLGLTIIAESAKFVWKNTINVLGVLVGFIGVGVLGILLTGAVILFLSS